MKRFFNEYVQSIETYIMFRIKQKTVALTEGLTKKGRKPISLSMGAPTANPPEYVIEQLKEALSVDNIHTYTIPRGENFFLEAVKEYMVKRFDVELDAQKEIFSLIGSKEGISNMIRGLISPHCDMKEQDIILVPDPAYASFKEMVKVSGGYGYPVPLTEENNYMPDMNEILDNLEKDGFDKKKVKALIINYPSNPLGACATPEYYKHVVEFCKKNDILLLSDVAYANTYFDENEIPTSVLQIEGAKDITVEFHSFSKPYAMTGWRLGWVCGNAEVISYFGKLKSILDTGVFKAIQYAGAKVLNSVEGDAYIKEANRVFKENCEFFVNGLKELGWEINNVPKATFYLWLKTPPRFNSSGEFADALLEKSGIVIVPGEGFGENGKGYFRASIVCCKGDLIEVLRRMKEDGFTYR